jgi:hypothetical protein
MSILLLTLEFKLNKPNTYVQLTRKTGKARLTIHAWEDMDRELFRLFDNNVFALLIPPDHVMVLLLLKKTVRRSLASFISQT